MPDRTAPTTDEIQRVREWECSGRGHSFDQIMTNESDIPHLLICDNCGKRARVMPDEPELHTWKDGKLYKLVPDGHQGEDEEEDMAWGEQQYILELVNKPRTNNPGDDLKNFWTKETPGIIEFDPTTGRER